MGIRWELTWEYGGNVGIGLGFPEGRDRMQFAAKLDVNVGQPGSFVLKSERHSTRAASGRRLREPSRLRHSRPTSLPIVSVTPSPRCCSSKARAPPTCQLGHASIQLTVDTYSKWLPMRNKPAVNRLDEQSGSKKRIGGSRYAGNLRFNWWAVKDSNLGPAD